LRVGLSGTTAIAGALGDDDACPTNPACNSGSAYVFELAPDAVQYGSCPSGAPCNNADDHGGCANSTGQGAILAACGSGSVAADDLVLEVRHLPPGVFAILFMGPEQVQVPFGDGIRCVGPGTAGLFRFPVQNAGATAAITLGPGIAAWSQGFPPAGLIAPGSTWNFQCWYRDPLGPCGGTFNLSNGLSASFLP
jgi:hypothetical protein